MEGSATLTIETSRIVMKNAVATTARIRQRCGFEVTAAYINAKKGTGSERTVAPRSGFG
jgi:hypothetical protein